MRPATSTRSAARRTRSPSSATARASPRSTREIARARAVVRIVRLAGARLREGSATSSRRGKLRPRDGARRRQPRADGVDEPVLRPHGGRAPATATKRARRSRARAPRRQQIPQERSARGVVPRAGAGRRRSRSTSRPARQPALSLAPWTGPDLPGSIASTMQVPPGRHRRAGHAASRWPRRGLPKRWIGSFCTDRVCAPFRTTVVLPGRRREGRRVPSRPDDAAHTVRRTSRIAADRRRAHGRDGRHPRPRLGRCMLHALVAATALALTGPQVGAPAPDFHLTTRRRQARRARRLPRQDAGGQRLGAPGARPAARRRPT